MVRGVCVCEGGRGRGRRGDPTGDSIRAKVNPQCLYNSFETDSCGGGGGVMAQEWRRMRCHNFCYLVRTLGMRFGMRLEWREEFVFHQLWLHVPIPRRIRETLPFFLSSYHLFLPSCSSTPPHPLFPCV